MPEDSETPLDPAPNDNVRAFEDMLNYMAGDEGPGLNVAELDTMQIVIMIRMRSIFTLEELHFRSHALIEKMEGWINQPGALRGIDGEPADAVLAENFEDNDDLIAMLAESTKSVTDDDLISLLDEEE